jgi:protease II
MIIAKKSEKVLEKLENSVYNEIISKIDQSDVSVPVKIDDFFYYSRDVEGAISRLLQKI